MDWIFSNKFEGVDIPLNTNALRSVYSCLIKHFRKQNMSS